MSFPERRQDVRQPARFLDAERPRPTPRLQDVVSTLADFAIVTFAVPPDALAKLLPEGFAPEVVRLDDGREAAFVSAVPFFDQDFRFGFAPFLRFRFPQTNYRAYVWHRGRRAVWFFGTTLDTAWVAVPQRRWKLPWHRAAMRFETRWDGERCASFRLEAAGPFGACDVELEGTDALPGRLDGFADEEDALVTLTHPLDGFFHRRDGRLGTYSVWHDRLELRLGHARRARFDVFETLGLVAKDQPPHSVLLTRATEFVVLLPPKLVAA